MPPCPAPVQKRKYLLYQRRQRQLCDNLQVLPEHCVAACICCDEVCVQDTNASPHLLDIHHLSYNNLADTDELIFHLD